MAKIVKCKTCGAQIAKTAKVCPKCGAKQHTVALTLCGIIVVITIFACVGILAGGNQSEPQKVANSNPSQNPQGNTETSSKPEKSTFSVGEQVSLNNVVVTLNSVTESDGSQFNKPSNGNTFIRCEFLIENNSEKDLAISSIMCFNAYVDDYSAPMSLSATIDADKGQLDGAIAAGKKMSGAIGYEVPKDWKELEIRFTPDFWSQKDITFVHKK